MNKNTYRGHRFPPAIIQLTVWTYARFTLSFRDVQELLAERRLDMSYETVRRWFLKLGQVYARNIRHRRTECLDEMVIVMGRRRFDLWRAVDSEREVLDFLVQRRRNTERQND
jgi:putative transposase